MRVYDAKQPKGTKLCNVEFGKLVNVQGSDGSMRGPLLHVNPEYPKDLPNASLDPDALPLPHPGTPPPPTQPTPTHVLPGAGGGWGSEPKALLLDPVTGTLYTAHPSTRAVVLNDAAIVRNYIEGAA